MKVSQNKWKILFVDDSKTEIKYLKMFFELTDHPLVPRFINSALEAVEELKTLEEEEFPDIIIVDINMPLMDGFEFADFYADNYCQKYPDTKLFIYSTSIHSADIRKAETTECCTGFLAKPFNEKTFNKDILPHLSINSKMSSS